MVMEPRTIKIIKWILFILYLVNAAIAISGVRHSNAGINFDLIMLLAIILPIVFAGIAFLLWYRYGKDEKVIETVEFYPPEGYNSAYIGFLYRGKIEPIDVVSLLFYFADKGYITISESEEKTFILNQKGFKITKLKEYDGNDVNEILFLRELFKEKKEVTSGDLRNTFYTALKEIIENINSKTYKEKIYEKSSLNKNYFIAGMIAAVFIFITYSPVIIYNVSSMAPYGVSVPLFNMIETLVLAVLFPGLGLCISFGGMIGVFNLPKWFALIFGGTFGGIPWALLVLPALLLDPIYILTYITGIISVMIMIVFIKYMTKRTAYGNEVLGRIKGFKSFLETVEKLKLEALVKQNPAYYYKILPFIYVIELPKNRIGYFESIAPDPPPWYSGSGTFKPASFGSFIKQTMEAASEVMRSRPSVSDYDSGSGGGGGRSW